MSEDEKALTAEVSKKEDGAERFRLQRTTARKRAMQFLYGLDVGKNWTELDKQLPAFKEMLTELDEDSETLTEPSLTKSLTYMEKLVTGVVQELESLDKLIAMAAMNWRLERMGPVDRCILRVASYEMGYVPKVSAATAINEAVELAKLFGQRESPRFINGVLDRIRRHGEQQTALEEAGIEVAQGEPTPEELALVAALENTVPEDGTVN